jgi:hypothetical protein
MLSVLDFLGVEKRLKRMPGVHTASVNIATNTAGRSRLYYDSSGRFHPLLMSTLSCCRRPGKVLIDPLGMRTTSEARPMSARVATARQPLDRSR